MILNIVTLRYMPSRRLGSYTSVRAIYRSSLHDSVTYPIDEGDVLKKEGDMGAEALDLLDLLRDQPEQVVALFNERRRLGLEVDPEL